MFPVGLADGAKPLYICCVPRLWGVPVPLGDPSTVCGSFRHDLKVCSWELLQSYMMIIFNNAHLHRFTGSSKILITTVLNICFFKEEVIGCALRARDKQRTLKNVYNRNTFHLANIKRPQGLPKKYNLFYPFFKKTFFLLLSSFLIFWWMHAICEGWCLFVNFCFYYFFIFLFIFFSVFALPLHPDHSRLRFPINHLSLFPFISVLMTTVSVVPDPPYVPSCLWNLFCHVQLQNVSFVKSCFS